MFPLSLDGDMRFPDPDDLGPMPFVEAMGRRLREAYAREIHLRADGLSFRGCGGTSWSPFVIVRCGTVCVVDANGMLTVRYTLGLRRIFLWAVPLFAAFIGLLSYGDPTTPSAGRGILVFLLVIAWLGGVNMLLARTRFRGILDGAWRDAKSQEGGR